MLNVKISGKRRDPNEKKTNTFKNNFLRTVKKNGRMFWENPPCLLAYVCINWHKSFEGKVSYICEI